jgi:hypothetical protein
MTAVLTGEVTLRMPQGRQWAWADLQEIPDDGHWEARMVLAGESVPVDTAFPVELRPADLVGPRRRS